MAVVLLLVVASTVSAQSISENDLKTNVLSIEKSVEKLQNLEPIYYSFNHDKFPHLQLAKRPQYGFKLASVQSNFPTIIKTNNKSYNGGKNYIKNATFLDIETESLIPVLVAAIQEQQIAIEQLKKEIKSLKSER